MLAHAARLRYRSEKSSLRYSFLLVLLRVSKDLRSGGPGPLSSYSLRKFQKAKGHLKKRII